MQSNQHVEQSVLAAYELGCEHARSAASWAVDGNTSQEHIRRVLGMLADGDPEAFDYLPAMPDLSGEWADSMTPERLRKAAADDLGVLPDESATIAICDAYESGVADTFAEECERILLAWLAD